MGEGQKRNNIMKPKLNKKGKKQNWNLLYATGYDDLSKNGHTIIEIFSYDPKENSLGYYIPRNISFDYKKIALEETRRLWAQGILGPVFSGEFWQASQKYIEPVDDLKRFFDLMSVEYHSTFMKVV